MARKIKKRSRKIISPINLRAMIDAAEEYPSSAGATTLQLAYKTFPHPENPRDAEVRIAAAALILSLASFMGGEFYLCAVFFRISYHVTTYKYIGGGPLLH